MLTTVVKLVNAFLSHSFHRLPIQDNSKVTSNFVGSAALLKIRFIMPVASVSIQIDRMKVWLSMGI